MKKKIFGAVVVVAIAVGALINVNLNKTNNKGDLAMANVEALAQPEGSQVSALGQWWNTSPANLTGIQYKGRESYSVNYQSGYTQNSSSYSINPVVVDGVPVPLPSYNSGNNSVQYSTVYCCKDSFNPTSCTYPPDPHC